MIVFGCYAGTRRLFDRVIILKEIDIPATEITIHSRTTHELEREMLI